ncbi:23S rRNA (pseudouridine(1915)-N(3))-methyltransferase RlmH [Paraphotobacterium marinum]|uniref:Ribosomal RNA large subunit methyltransferase H n=1 Tax=Paraphotobacterium marinum TaxID=1755811 RepID=A0A220VBQ6_9GAMM|nr:23S rRNA (pseudouridine(1915)-N(3))-methyltransferase RlmH [Paraphotobacterium marinum]ASK77785.1 23S rRNA (pseudouridine(1915)-N(3))-methyltransferase RlmH [Paraphotobacterium marinum]
MKIQVVAIGTKMPKWVNEGIFEYTKRFTKDCPITFTELPLTKRNKNSNLKSIIQNEGKLILSSIQKNSIIIALDVYGSNMDTEQLAIKFDDWKQSGKNITFLIGGPDGLSKEILEEANLKWSLSKLTLPHPIVRIILVESLYRAMTISINHPYHRN